MLVGVLAEVIRSSPQVMLENASQLKEAFVYMMSMPSPPAIALIKAVLVSHVIVI